MIEVLKQALEALEANDQLINGSGTKGGLVYCMDGYYSDCFDVDPINKQTDEAIAAIKEALAQQEQEYDNSAVHLAHCYQGEYPVCKYGDENCPAIPKVKAQPEQEPPLSAKQAYAMAQVCLDLHDALGCKWGDNPYLTISQLKASQQQRTWVGLTRIELIKCGVLPYGMSYELYQAIEAKLKQKNG